MDSNRDAEAGGSGRRVRAWDAPVLVALASVVVALIYNGVQASNTADQLDQGQRTLELNTEAQTFATFTQVARVGAEVNAAGLALNKDPSEANQLRLLNAITPLEAS